MTDLLFMSKQGLLALGDYMNVQCHACIGGTNVGEDIRKLDYGQHVVAGTPGRVFGKIWEASCFCVHASIESWDHPTNLKHLDLK